MYFFHADVLFSIENAIFWPILAHFGYFVANLCTSQCTFTGLDNAVVCQNWQISDIRWGGCKKVLMDKFGFLLNQQSALIVWHRPAGQHAAALSAWMRWVREIQDPRIFCYQSLCGKLKTIASTNWQPEGSATKLTLTFTVSSGGEKSWQRGCIQCPVKSLWPKIARVHIIAPKW